MGLKIKLEGFYLRVKVVSFLKFIKEWNVRVNDSKDY